MNLKKVPYMNIWADQNGDLFLENGTQMEKFQNSFCNKYYSVRFQNRWYFVHRLVYFAWFPELNIPQFYTSVDHINRKSLDNRPKNLRMLSTSLQNLNRDFKGYSRIKNTDRLRSRITFNKKKYTIGTYKIAENASKIYRIVKQKLFEKIYMFEIKTNTPYELTKKVFKEILKDAKENFRATFKRNLTTLHTRTMLPATVFGERHSSFC